VFKEKYLNKCEDIIILNVNINEKYKLVFNQFKKIENHLKVKVKFN